MGRKSYSIAPFTGSGILQQSQQSPPIGRPQLPEADFDIHEQPARLRTVPFAFP